MEGVNTAWCRRQRGRYPQGGGDTAPDLIASDSRTIPHNRRERTSPPPPNYAKKWCALEESNLWPSDS